MAPDAVLLPKVTSAGDIDMLAKVTGSLPIWAMMGTPLAVLQASEIARHVSVHGMVMGTNDLLEDLQSRLRSDRLALIPSLAHCVLAAKAHGVIIIIDGVYNVFKDERDLLAECEQGRDMGFDGKTLIHPAQIEIANRCFAPSCEEIDRARRQIEAFLVARAEGAGVAVVDGQIVERLHVETARQMLEKVDMIGRLTLEMQT